MSEPDDTPLRYNEEGNVHLDFHGAVNTTIDFIVSRDAMVWPMVPQGVGNSSVQYARDHAPEWEEE